MTADRYALKAASGYARIVPGELGRLTELLGDAQYQSRYNAGPYIVLGHSKGAPAFVIASFRNGEKEWELDAEESEI